MPVSMMLDQGEEVNSQLTMALKAETNSSTISVIASTSFLRSATTGAAVSRSSG